MFEKIVFAPDDPILSVSDSFNNDLRKNKINLSVGVYRDFTGKVSVLDVVKKTEKFLLRNENSKNYLSIDGKTEFNQIVQKLIFGSGHEIITSKRVCTVQTIGGTGALHIAADFVAKQTDAKSVWISNPTWINHKNIFEAAGLKIKTYDYYDVINHNINFNAMLNDLSDSVSGDIIILHGCCHNPTGVDPTTEQWFKISDLCARKNILPVFDFAYHGFCKGINEDFESLRIFSKNNKEIIIATSFSKNFGLYNDRIGACTFVAKNSNNANRIFSQIKAIIRSKYSTPPAHGAEIVTTILSEESLKISWLKELKEMRDRIKYIRKILIERLKKISSKKNFDFIANQNGMFSLSGFTKKQIECLRDEFGIYILNTGRINIASITLDNINYLCDSIVKIL
ncbi:Aspartate aminotransferase [Candidatus Providencia siddallii]|uniref:Aminotransferase n=1 Tax=Candidatus Providencia siddallii TaxID=1715285 RepID=A0A0M6W6Z0_9GAMM|nr:Aspartate aminotransferase [Candidatus Providencia siddallii]